MANFFDEVSSFISALSGTDEAKVKISCNGDSITLPIPPDSYNISVSNKNEVINVINLGELNMMGRSGLKSISISSIFPARNYYFCVTQPEQPKAYIQKLEAWRVSLKPLSITISNSPVNLTCLIDGFTWGEKDATGDIFYKIDFKEYRTSSGKAGDSINGSTGLFDVIENIASASEITAYPQDDVVDVMRKSVGSSSTINNKNIDYLAAARAAMKSGGIQTGDTVAATAAGLKIGDKNVLL